MSKKLIYFVSFVLVLSIVGYASADLVVHWGFDEGSGSIVHDTSGNGHDGTINGMPQWVPGIAGSALHFDGSTYVVVADDIGEFETFSIALWFKYDSFIADWNAIWHNNGWQTGWLHHMVTNYAGQDIRVQFALNGLSPGKDQFGITPIETDVWYHSTVTYDSIAGQMNFYLTTDEEKKANLDVALSVSGPATIITAGQIGGWEGGRLSSATFDDIRMYDHILSEVEILSAMAGKIWPYALGPVPADGAIHPDTWVNLSWTPGGHAVSHDVYLGENIDDVNDGTGGTFQGNQTDTFFVAGFPGFAYPDGLIPGTTYYWRIDEVNDTEPNSPWKGNVWSFSISPNTADAPAYFEITYYDNYNYDTGQWDAWQSDATPQDAWDDKYLTDGSSGNTVYTDHAFPSIAVFDLRGGLFSKDGHTSGGNDWNPLQSIGDNVSGQSAHHVFAVLFKGLIYLEEGDNLMVASDDDVYVFLDGDTAWGQEVLSIPSVSHFGTDSMTVTAAHEGYHTITVKYIERLNIHSGIEITLNGEHLQNAEVVIDIEPGRYPLSEALDTILSFTTGGNEDWFNQTTTSQYGGDAVQSGDISHSQDSWMQTTVSGAGTVSFFWKVSSEAGYDFLEFYIDGSLQDQISGSVSWQQKMYTITTAGSHTLEWRYVKDKDTDSGSDCGWVDNLEWVPTPPPPPKGRGCFPADTPVWVNGALVQISNVVPGQMVGGLHCGLATNRLKQIETVEEHEGTFECRDIVLESGNRISVVDA